MPSQLDDVLGTNLRNDATAENRTNCSVENQATYPSSSTENSRDSFYYGSSEYIPQGCDDISPNFTRVTLLVVHNYSNKSDKRLRKVYAEDLDFQKYSIKKRIALCMYDKLRCTLKRKQRAMFKVKSMISRGVFSSLATLLEYQSLRLKIVSNIKTHVQAKPEAGWDLLGTHDLAESLRQLGEKAAEIAAHTSSSVDRTTSSVDGIKDAVLEAITMLIPELNKGNSTAAKIATEGLSINMFKDFIDLFSDPANISLACGILYVFLEYAERRFELEELRYIRYLVGIYALFKVSGPMRNFIFTWFEKKEAEAEAGWGEWFEVGAQAMIFAVFGTCIESRTLIGTIKSLGDAACNTKKLTEMFTVVIEWFKNVITMVCETCNIEVFEWLKPADTKIRNFISTVNDLNQQYADDPMNIDIAFVEDVTRLMMELNDYIKNVPITTKNTPVLNALRGLQDKLSILQRNVADAGMNIGDRDEPAMLVIAGAPGIGKTYKQAMIVQRLAFAFAQDMGDLIDVGRNWKRQVYTWPMDSKHHDQYKGEPIIQFPDLFCQTDAEGQPSEASNLIYLKGDQPMNLLAAELSKKQKLFVISKAIVAATNVTYIHPKMFKSMRNLDALIRRVNECSWYMWVNPMYIKRNPDGTPKVDASTNRVRGYEHDDEMYGAIDTARIPNPEPADLYFYRKLDFSTGTFSDNRIYVHEGFMAVVEQYITNLHGAGLRKREKMTENVEALMARRRDQMMGVIPEHGDIAFIEAQVRVVPPLPEYRAPYELRARIPRPRRHAVDDDEEFVDARAEMNNIAVHPRVEREVASERSPLYPTDAFKVAMLHLTRAQHQRMREISNDALHLVQQYGVRDVQGFANAAGRAVFRGDPANGAVFLVLQGMVKHMDEDIFLDGATRVFGLRTLLKIVHNDYDTVRDKYVDWQFEELIKDPVIRTLTQCSNFLSTVMDNWVYPVLRGTWNKVCAAGNAVRTKLIQWMGMHHYQNMVQGLSMGAGLYGSCFIFLVCLDIYMSYSSKRKVKQLKKERRAALKEDTKAESMYTDAQQVNQTLDKHMDNLAALYVAIQPKNVIRHPCNVIFLGGKTAVMVKHAANAMRILAEGVDKTKGEYLEVIICPYTGKSHNISTERIRFDDIIFDTSDDLDQRDMEIVTFKTCRNRCDIYNSIPPLDIANDLYNREYLEGIFVERPFDKDSLVIKGPEVRHKVYFDLNDDYVSYGSTVTTDHDGVRQTGDFRYKSLYMTGSEEKLCTQPGYCCSPGYITDERKNAGVRKGWPQAQQPWLAYFHTASQRTVPHGVPLYRELFTKWIDQLKARNVKFPVDAINQNIQEHMEVMCEELNITNPHSSDVQVVPHILDMDANHKSFGSMDHQFFVPFKSEIKRSKIYGISKVTRYPTRMGKVKTVTGIIDVMQDARENYGRNNASLNGTLVRSIIHQAMARVVSDSGPMKNRDLLTLDQCLYGDNAYNLNSINWNSSVGFYMRMVKDTTKQKWKGKRWMLDNDVQLTPKSLNIVEKLFNLNDAKLLRGERIYGINIDNIKDELLSEEKLKQGRGRLFCTNDFISLLLCKKYMGAFAGWIYENRVRNGIAIGVNPYSDEWTSIVVHLKKTSVKAVFLDHAKFDKDQLREVMESVLVLMDMFYGDAGSVNSEARRLLFEDIQNSVHVVMYEGRLFFYMWDQGNTSGNFLTAILNSLVNISYFYICSIYCWLIHQGINPESLTSVPANPADKSLAYITLGDDIAATINDVTMPGVNFNTLCMAGKKYLNIKMTDELKTEGIIPDFREVEEGSFLGRRFISRPRFGVPRYCSPLRLYSCIEKVQWIKGESDPEIEIAKFEDMNLELSQHPPALFNAIVPRYAEACLKAYGRYPNYTNYEVAYERLLSISTYKYAFGDFMNGDGTTDGPSLTGLLLIADELKALNKYAPDVHKEGISDISFECIDMSESCHLDLDDKHKVTEKGEVDAPRPLKTCISKNYNKLNAEPVLELAAYDISKMSSTETADESRLSSNTDTVCQMDNTTTDFTQKVELDTKATTTFYEAANTMSGTSSRSTYDVSTYVESNNDIKSFLMRPVLLSNGTWTVGDAPNTNLATGRIAPLLQNIPMWADKTRGFNLIRGDFMIKVQINASPFHQGKCLLHYLPCHQNFLLINGKYDKVKNKLLVQKIQHPHIEVDCRSTSVTMRIPYVAPTAWYSMKDAYYDWGTWWLDVFSSLNTGTAAPPGELYVDYLVYGWFENVELNAPTYPQSNNKAVRRGGAEESKENQGPIALALRKTSKVANVLSAVPLLNTLAAPVEWAANIAANVAGVLGWSKPRELEGQDVVMDQQFRYAGTCDGPDVAIPGGISCLNRLETIDYGSYTREDEMSLAFLYSIPLYGGEFSWSSSAGQGANLFSKKISPQSICTTASDSVGTHTVTYEHHAPFTYLAKMHREWRGKINLTLKFIKTQMHSGRLQITWTPLNNPAIPLTLTTSSFNKRAIIDIRTEDTVSLELPYLLYSDYIPVSTEDQTFPYSGQIDVVVLNDLRSPESCAQSIQVQYFWTAGEDYELAIPNVLMSGNYPYVPQMNDHVVSGDGAELLENSIQQGMSLPTEEIGGKSTTTDLLFYTKRCVGEKILSIKSFLLRNSPLQLITGASWGYAGVDKLLIDPYMISACTMESTTGLARRPELGGDIYSLLAPMYAFSRGGIRMTYADLGDESNRIITACLSKPSAFTLDPVSITTNSVGPLLKANNPFTMSNSYPLTACNFQEKSSAGYQHIPYYSRMPMQLVTYYDGLAATPSIDPSRSSSVFQVSTSKTISDTTMLQRAVADDYQLMFFTGCPPLPRSYA